MNSVEKIVEILKIVIDKLFFVNISCFDKANTRLT